MVIKGKKVYLRTMRERDVDTIYEFMTSVESRGLYYPLYVTSEAKFKQDFQRDGFWGSDGGDLLICDFDDQILGAVYFFKIEHYFSGYEIAYRLFDVGDSGGGLMTEALSLFTYVLFVTKPINRLELKILPENGASKRVAEKCGYTCEGVARGAFFHRGQHRDLEVYAILRNEAPQTLDEVLAQFETGT